MSRVFLLWYHSIPQKESEAKNLAEADPRASFGGLLSPVGQSLSSCPFPLDPVAVGKGSFEPVDEVWHCVLAPLATVLE
jgi:hypothetical protein